MKSRQKLPMYAEWEAIHLSRRQFDAICKGRVPKGIKESHNSSVRVAKTKDGKYWAEWKGEAVFWASRWYEVPKTVGKRAEAIEEFILSL